MRKESQQLASAHRERAFGVAAWLRARVAELYGARRDQLYQSELDALVQEAQSFGGPIWSEENLLRALFRHTLIAGDFDHTLAEHIIGYAGCFYGMLGVSPWYVGHYLTRRERDEISVRFYETIQQNVTRWRRVVEDGIDGGTIEIYDVHTGWKTIQFGRTLPLSEHEGGVRKAAPGSLYRVMHDALCGRAAGVLAAAKYDGTPESEEAMWRAVEFFTDTQSDSGLCLLKGRKIRIFDDQRRCIVDRADLADTFKDEEKPEWPATYRDAVFGYVPPPHDDTTHNLSNLRMRLAEALSQAGLPPMEQRYASADAERTAARSARDAARIVGRTVVEAAANLLYGRLCFPCAVGGASLKWQEAALMAEIEEMADGDDKAEKQEELTEVRRKLSPLKGQETALLAAIKLLRDDDPAMAEKQEELAEVRRKQSAGGAALGEQRLLCLKWQETALKADISLLQDGDPTKATKKKELAEVRRKLSPSQHAAAAAAALEAWGEQALQLQQQQQQQQQQQEQQRKQRQQQALLLYQQQQQHRQQRQQRQQQAQARQQQQQRQRRQQQQQVYAPVFETHQSGICTLVLQVPHLGCRVMHVQMQSGLVVRAEIPTGLAPPRRFQVQVLMVPPSMPALQPPPMPPQPM